MVMTWVLKGWGGNAWIMVGGHGMGFGCSFIVVH